MLLILNRLRGTQGLWSKIIGLLLALVDGNETARLEAVGYRDYLRDLPAQCDGKSFDELKTILEGLA